MNIKDMLKKRVYMPILCHVALFLAVIILLFTENYFVYPALMAELCGVLITPMFYAVASIANSILNGEKVFRYFKPFLLALVIIGVLRIALYAWLVTGMLYLAAGALFVSILIFIIWEALFALTEGVMKKKRQRKHK